MNQTTRRPDSPARFNNPIRSETTFPQSRLIQPIVFFGGVTSIGIELSASRLLAPYFGSSTFIWANLIGLTLTFLSVGYYIGGRVADRRPDPRLLYLITALAAASAGLIPIVARPILDRSLDAFDKVEVGAFYGSLVGTIFLLAIPVTLLGFVTPFAIRLQLRDVNGSGRTAGRVYALSTFGSIVGSFLPVMVLIPLFGTRASFLALSAALLTLSLAGLIETRSITGVALASASAALIVVTNLFAAEEIKPAYRGELIYEAESEYNYIQVLRDGDEWLLALNEGHAVHSIFNPYQLLTGGPWDYFVLSPLFSGTSTSSPNRALMIGLAGGTAARQLIAAYPRIEVDGVEIDPEVAAVGRTYFGLTNPQINVVIEDGRYFVRTTDSTYDIIGIDAYRQPYIPFQLTTREFFQEVRAQLNDCGVAVVNVGRTATDYRLVEVIASTMRSVFPNVFAVDVNRFANTMVFGTVCPASIETFTERAAALPADSISNTVAGWALASGNIRVIEPGGRVFTDDHAPVELVVDVMIVDAARGATDDGESNE